MTNFVCDYPSVQTKELIGGSSRPFRAGGFAQLELRKYRWIALCAARLAILRPSLRADEIRSLAAEMWRDVHEFDPVIAAEIEHESGFFDA